MGTSTDELFNLLNLLVMLHAISRPSASKCYNGGYNPYSY